MKLTPNPLFQAMHGSILGRQSPWHVRTSKNGCIFSARSGNPQKNPTARQLAHQQCMRDACLLYRQIISDPNQLAIWNQKLSHQSRYRNLRALVIGSVLKGAV